MRGGVAWSRSEGEVDRPLSSLETLPDLRRVVAIACAGSEETCMCDAATATSCSAWLVRDGHHMPFGSHTRDW